MTLVTLATNNVPVEDRNYTLQAVDGFATVPQRTFQVVSGPLIVGGRVVAPGSSAAARTFNCQLLIRPTSLTDRQAVLDDFVAQHGGLIEVSKVDAPTRVCYGVLTQATVAQPPGVASHPFARPESVIAGTITCDDPLYYARDPQLLNIAAGERRALTMGNAPLRRIQIVVFGAATNPTISLRDQTGTVVETMVLTGTLGATDYLTIDCGFALQGGRSITKSDGTDLLQAGWLSMPQTFFNPRPPMLNPTLESTAGAMRVQYVPAWWN